MLRHRIAALVALFAVAFAALWPLVSVAKLHGAGVPSFICTQAGGPHVPLPDGDAGDDFHCPLCIASGDFIPASIDVPRVAALPLEMAAIAAPPDTAHDVYTPHPPPTRAPPVLS